MLAELSLNSREDKTSPPNIISTDITILGMDINLFELGFREFRNNILGLEERILPSWNNNEITLVPQRVLYRFPLNFRVTLYYCRYDGNNVFKIGWE